MMNMTIIILIILMNIEHIVPSFPQKQWLKERDDKTFQQEKPPPQAKQVADQPAIDKMLSLITASNSSNKRIICTKT